MPKITITGNRHYWLTSWTLANIIQIGTQDFCERFLNHQNDPCGRQFDQMTQAARSAQANIAEGNARHETSRETEIRLTDVAKASLAELSADYQNWIMHHGSLPWSTKSAEYAAFRNIRLDRAVFKEDVLYNSAKHITEQKHKFDTWLQADDSIAQANCLMYMCSWLETMLEAKEQKHLADFKEEGGFTEAMTAERLEARTQQAAEASAPVCPICGKPMLRRMAKKGINAGKPFWSCSDYPNCRGTRPWDR